MWDTNFNKVKIIGFDLDQTLYPKSPEIDEAIQKYIYEKIASRLNIDTETAREKFRALYQEGRGLSGSKSLVALGFDTEEAKESVQEALEKAEIAKFLVPDPRVVSLLSKLSDKYTLDLITGSDRNNTDRKLKSLDIPRSIFRHIITKDDADKSDGSAYKIWLAKYPEHSSDEFLYIGDRIRTDYEIPLELGIRSILVNINEPDESLRSLQLTNLLEIERYLVV